MRGLYQSSVSAAPLTARDGPGDAGAAAEAEQRSGEGKVEVVELADGFRITLPRGVSTAEEEQQRQKQQKPTVHIEKVVNAWGSAAGAGSDFFDCYRRTRNVELRRVEKMEEDFRKKVETEEFQLQRHRRIEEAAKKNAAARERRRRRKMKQQEQQRSRVNVKKPDSAAAAHGVSAVDPAAVNDSAGAAVGNGGSSSADGCAPDSGEARMTQNSGESEADKRTSLRSPPGERRVKSSRKLEKEQRRGDGRNNGAGEAEGGGEDESVSSEESEGTKSDTEEENDARQNPGRKRRRTAERADQNLSATAHTDHCRSQSDEPKGRQLGSDSTARPTETTICVNPLAKEEEAEGGGEAEDAHLPVMKAGMVTVHDDDW